MQITGKVLLVTPTVQKTEKFRGRDLIVETADNPQYPQKIKIEAGNDKCDLLNNINVGDQVEVEANLNGREWTNKEGVVSYFNSISIWKIKVLEASAPIPVAAGGPDDDDLPF